MLPTEPQTLRELFFAIFIYKAAKIGNMNFTVSLILAVCWFLVNPIASSVVAAPAEKEGSQRQWKQSFTLSERASIGKMEFSSDSQRLFVLTRRLYPDLESYRIMEGEFVCWGVKSRRKLWKWRGQNAPLLDFAVHPRRKLVALASDAAVWIRESETGKTVARLPHARCVAFSKDGRYLATAGDNIQTKKQKPTRVVLKLWNVNGWALQQSTSTKLINGFGNSPSDFWVTGVDFSSTGHLVATTAVSILIDWDLTSPNAPRVQSKPSTFVKFAPDGKTAIIREQITVLGDGNDPSTLTLIDSKTWKPLNS
ncbi:MAG TPA: hypothetical protein VF627_03620, partial [Abditibacterium sp.]